MRAHTETVYTAKELREKFPDAFERARRQHEKTETTLPWSEETWDSVQACCKAAGVHLDRRGHYAPWRASIPGEEGTAELRGVRALAWIENNLLAQFRIPWVGRKRWELAKYGAWYRPGMVEPCPFTGYCFDEDCIYHLRRELLEGATLGEAFSRLGDAAEGAIEAEAEYHFGPDGFTEMAEANSWEFRESGERI